MSEAPLLDSGGNTAAPSLRAVFPALAFLAFMFYLNFTSRVICSPLLPVMSEELGLNHTDAGSFFLFISMGYFTSILLSGHVSSRIHHSATIVVSTFFSGVMLLVLSLITSLSVLRLGLGGLGFAGGLYLPSGLATITTLVPAGYLARGMSIHELAPNIAFVITPLICAAGLFFMSWRMILALLGCVLIVTALLYLLFGTKNRQYGAVPHLATMLQVIRFPGFWRITCMFSMAICSTLGIYAMLPLYLVSVQGMELENANSLVAASRLGSVAMPLFSGWLGDKFGNELVMGLVLFFAGLLTVPLGFTSGWVLTMLIIIQPMVAVCFFPSAFAVLSNIGPVDKKNMAISVCIPLAFLGGGGILPTLMGVIGDTINLGTGLSMSGLLMVTTAICAMGLIRKLDK